MKKLSVAFGIFALTVSTAFADIANKTNGEFVTLSGKVSDVKANSFTLNTNNNKVMVEMDDYSSWVADGFKLVNGDQVVVNGRVDKDFLEKKKVEAGSVYVKNIDTYFYASSADEEDLTYLPTTYSLVGSLPEGAQIDLQGDITKIQGREMTVDTGIRKIVVDTGDMGYNPLDNKGFTKLNVGDRVRVSGQVEDNLFETKEVAASYVTELPTKI